MSDSRWMGLLFAAAFLARLVSCLGAALFGTDSGHYLLMADWMREGRFDEALSIAYHPLYPLLIAAARSVTVSTEQAGNAVSLLLGAAAILPLFRTVLEIFGRPTAVLTALLYAFSPLIAEVQSDVMTEGCFFFFLFATQWLTWRMMQAPSLDRAVVLGGCAAAAFLTRAEGLLAIAFALGWPLLVLIRRRDAVGVRLCGLMLTLTVMVLLVSPYLLWMKEFKGRWALSARPGVVSTEQGMGIAQNPETPDPKTPPPLHFYLIFLKSVLHLTVYGLWIPFMLVGVRVLTGAGPGRWFYFSLPLVHVAGVLNALRSHPFMSDRYLMAPMALLGVLTALGMLAALRALKRRGGDARWVSVACGSLVLAVVVLPVLKLFQLRRLECRSYPVAAAKILDQGSRPRAMSGPVEQIAYFCGVRSYYGATTHEGIHRQIEEHHVECYVYSERDVAGRPEYVKMLRSCPFLKAPVELVGAPGTLTVYYQRSE